MKITTRTTGADVVVEVDGKEIAAFDHIEGNLRDAKMGADAFARGLEAGLELARTQSTAPDKDATDEQMRLFVWDSEAASNGVHAGTVAAMALYEDSAREKIYSAAAAHSQRCKPGYGISMSQLEHDLDRPAEVSTHEAIVFTPG